MKKAHKKLVLRQESLAKLTTLELSFAVGGIPQQLEGGDTTSYNCEAPRLGIATGGCG